MEGARDRGLPALRESREERRRALILGKVRLRSLPPQFWLWTLVILSAFGVVYWKLAQGELESAKTRVMAKQRAVAQALGAKLVPFRENVERWAAELAADAWPGDMVTDDLDVSKLARSPGVYLRARQSNAKSASALRRAAVASLHDGFTSCFFVRDGAVDPARGPKCQTTGDCQPGQLCNEYDVCAAPAMPYNMRLAYRALRVLSPEWTDELHEAGSDLAVTAYERDLDKVTRTDVPVAVDLLTRARYLTIVLDEDPQGGLPNEPDAGAETPEERVQRTPHFARVGVWDLKSGKLVARVRAEASGQVVPVGKRAVQDPEVMAAQQRQVNSCALALHVKQALGPARTAQGATAPQP